MRKRDGGYPWAGSKSNISSQIMHGPCVNWSGTIGLVMNQSILIRCFKHSARKCGVTAGIPSGTLVSGAWLRHRVAFGALLSLWSKHPEIFVQQKVTAKTKSYRPRLDGPSNPPPGPFSPCSPKQNCCLHVWLESRRENHATSF